jgi:hypothetical protein
VTENRFIRAFGLSLQGFPALLLLPLVFTACENPQEPVEPIPADPARLGTQPEP